MPLLTKNTYTIPGKGTVNTKRKTFTGKGKGPAGTRKVREPTAATTPTVTVSPAGRTTTSGFASKQAAGRAVRRARASRRRARRITQSSAPKAQKASQRVAEIPSYTPPKPSPPLPASKPPTFQGRKTAWEPTYASLSKAAKTGKLAVNQRGYLTTPPIRRAASELKKARRGAAKSTGIQGPLVPEQKRFVKGVAKHTGLNPRAVAAQALAEQSGPAAQGYEAGGEHNYLNIGPGQHFGSNREAVRETAKLLNTSSNYAGIRAARGKGAAAQVQAIGASPWGTVLSTMQGTLPQVSVKHNPKAAKRLKVTEANASKLGLKVGAPKKAKRGRVPSVVYIGQQAQKKFGLHVGENAAFGGVAPVHEGSPKPGGGFYSEAERAAAGASYHYADEAIDVSGAPEQMLAFDQWVAQKWGKGVTELFYDPGISIKEGSEIGAIGGHGDHVHVSVAMPGQTFQGGYTAGPGGAMFVGYGGSASAAASSAAGAARAAAEGQGRTVSPWQRYWRVKRKLKRLGVGLGEATEPTTSTTLAALERKYGVKAA